ncbi:MAG: DUF1294 domain-containing protein [Clostridia bacterium]|nr:DUF1294 domain-containing protein [Clostridia bacterium]
MNFHFPPSSPAEWIPYILVYLGILSGISACVTIADKIKAKNGVWRVQEATLLLLSALGGSAAMYITMRLIRHKTKHRKFMLGIPLIMVFQCITVLYLWLRFLR